MGIFNTIKENRAMSNQMGTEQRGMFAASSFSSIFASNTWKIDEDKAMQVPSVVACVDLISGAIAQMPLRLYKQEGNSSIPFDDDPRLKFLNEEANEIMNGYSLKKQMTKDFLLYGGTFIKADKEKDSNDLTGLYYLPARNIFITKFITDGYKITANIRLSTIEGLPYGPQINKEIVYEPWELMFAVADTFDGISTVGILQKGGKVIQQALNEIEYTNNIFERGALPLGVLKMAGKLTDQSVADRLRESWSNLYGGSRNSAKTVLLEEGMEYEPVSLNPEDLQLNSSKTHTISEICKLFGVPESMISTANNKYNTIEQNQLNFLKHTLSPIMIAFESAINRSLLLEEEKEQGYYFRFDTSELLRATEKEKIEAVQAGWQGGLFTINEARNKLDLPSIDDDVFMWGLQSVLFNPETGEMKVPNMGMTGGESNQAQNQNGGNTNDKTNAKNPNSNSNATGAPEK